jgi:hypothetical protein
MPSDARTMRSPADSRVCTRNSCGPDVPIAAPGAPSVLTAPVALTSIGGGVPQAIQLKVDDTPCQRARVTATESSAPPTALIVSWTDVSDPQPRAVRVLDVVEPVTADVIAREHVAGDGGPGDARDAWRQQRLLHFGGGARGLAPPARLEEVGVPARELERRRRMPRELRERGLGRTHRQQQTDGTAAQVERSGAAQLVSGAYDKGQEQKGQVRRDMETGKQRGRDQARQARAKADKKLDGDGRGAAALPARP